MEQGKVVSTASDTLRYINLTGLARDIDLVPLCGRIHLCECVREERGDGEGVGSQTLSSNLTDIGELKE